MSDTDDKNQDLILKLDAEHRRDIAGVRISMEKFLRGQLDLEHKMEIVATNQNGLKERFEMGVSKTLCELDQKFDAFMMEWGTKKAEDVQRDKQIGSMNVVVGKAHDRIDFLLKGFALSVFGSLALVAIIWAVKTLLH